MQCQPVNGSTATGARQDELNLRAGLKEQSCLNPSMTPPAPETLQLLFYDHSAFTRAFRSATGVTPTEYRRSFDSG